MSVSRFSINGKTYNINDIESLSTPVLLVFEEYLLHNFRKMRNYLYGITDSLDFEYLCPHVKTHKSSFITGKQLDEGIRYFKSTPNEVDMLVKAGVKNIFIAYPLLKHDAVKVASLIQSQSDIRMHVQIGNEDHFNILREVVQQNGIKWHYLMDIDVGMHRTGMPAENAWRLYRKISTKDNFVFEGFHGYDGHIYFTEEEKRRDEANLSMKRILDVCNLFLRKKVKVNRVVVAGSPSFDLDLAILFPKIGRDALLQVSPGTWIYWDSKYESIMPGKFEFAALILAQVMDIQWDRITLNLGHKRWAVDQGPIELFSEPDWLLISYSEEHTVLKSKNSPKYKVGDYVLIVPRHICSTVNLYEYFTFIDKSGNIKERGIAVDGRNR